MKYEKLYSRFLLYGRFILVMKKYFLMAFVCLRVYPLMGQDHFVIKIGLVPDSPPTAFVDKKGNPSGFYTELFSRILDELGYSYEYTIGGYTELYEGLLDNQVDFFFPITRDAGREPLFHWLQEPASIGWGQFFMKAGYALKDIQQLQNRKVGIVEDDIPGRNYLKTLELLGIPVEPVLFSDFQRLADAVTEEKILGGVSYNTLIWDDKRVQPRTLVSPPPTGYAATSADNMRMVPIADQISQRLIELKGDPDSYYWALYERWISAERRNQCLIPLPLVSLLFLLSCTAAMIVVFTRLFRKKVIQRTRRLSDLTVTLQKKTEESSRELEEVAEKLIQSEQQALASRLVPSIAHEINTPIGVALTSLTYNQDLLKNLNKLYSVGNLGAADFKKYLKSSGESMDLCLLNLQRAIDLIRNFKNVSAQQVREEMSVVNLKEYTKDVILTVYPELKKTRLKVHTNLADRMIQTYPGALTHILINLILNSINHGFEQGEEGDIYISFLREKETCRILYSDNGKGIPPETAQDIFKPFYTTGRDKGNSGLGLSILMSVLKEKLKGSVELRTKPGRYTCFDIRFPVHRIS